MENYNEKVSRCALNRIFGFHPQTAHALVEKFGSAATLFEMGPSRLHDIVGAGYKNLDFINDNEYEAAEVELREVEAIGARFLSSDSPHYPALLKECEDYPVGLYVRSESPIEEIFPSQRRYVAVIGTRDLTSYGKQWCERIVEAFAEATKRPTIVSGLAIGTDISAHRKALECGLPTIAVIPTGIDATYPLRHTTDARRICKAPGGAVVTDYPLRTAPHQFNFLRRNRIIAGLCSDTILIESKARGGGMMTSRLAFSYFRDVYAIPGRTDDVRSGGCNILIHDKVAEAIVSTDSLLEGMGLKARRLKPQRAEVDREELSSKFSCSLCGRDIDQMADLLLAIKNAPGTDVEQLSRTCNLEYKHTVELLSLLECDGLIKIDLMQRCSINYH